MNSCSLWILLLSVLGVAKGQNPEIVNDILPAVVRLGQTARLNCTVARLDRSNTIQWSYVGSDNYVISRDQTIKVLNNRISGIASYEVKRIVQGTDQDRVTFQLIIARVRKEFSGPYECMIVTPNKNSNSYTKKRGLLTVQYSPVIDTGSSQFVKMVDKGSDDTIQCNADGVPAPNITWARSDGHLLPNGKALHRGKMLVIKGAAVGYTGVYRCVADNNIKPPAEALFQISVYQEPRVRVLQDSVGQYANGRLEAKLDCIVQGFPAPSVTWGKYEGAQFLYLTNNDKYQTTKQVTDMQNLMNGEQWYTLTIKNILASDYQKYYCMANNYKGEANATVTLFSTFNCQGPLCYSIQADNKNEAGLPQLSPLFLLTTGIVLLSFNMYQ